MDDIDVSTSGMLSLNIGKKKTAYKWKVTAKPNKTKKDTMKINMDMHMNETHKVIEVDASRNKDTTMNIKGTMTTIQGKKKVLIPLISRIIK